MKRKRYMVLMAVSAVLLCLFVRDLTEIPSRWGTTVLRPTADDASSGEKKEPSAVAPINEKTEPWRKAYAEILRSSEAEMFSFCYVDGDDIPELVLHMSKAFSHDNNAIQLYTYYNSKAVLLSEQLCCDGYSNFLYTPKTGYIISGFFNADYGAYEVFQLADGCVSSLHAFDEYQKEEPEYHIDNRSVPVWVYRRNFYRYTKGSANDYGDYDLTEENIRITLDV